MLRKAFSLFIVSSLIIILGGCETLKGAAGGAKKDWVGVQNAWNHAREADAWVQKNLW